MTRYSPEEQEILDEINAEIRLLDKLPQYARLHAFVSRSKGRDRKGKKRLRTKNGRKIEKEVELVEFLPSGRCVTLTDDPRNGLDLLAEEIFSPEEVPPHITPFQHLKNVLRGK